MHSRSIRNYRYLTIKEFCELGYWKFIKLIKKGLPNDHYKYFYTAYFSLPESFYNNKIILDIGCGPRGSLEWANCAKTRIGVDPLAQQYLSMGAKNHAMTYVEAYAEHLPFPDNFFDVISSFNSLDHVENIETACNEIQRTLKSGGIFLLIVDIHPRPTVTEPQTLNWDLVRDFFPSFEIVEEKHLERVVRNRIYSNLRMNIKISDNHKQVGVLTARLRKKES